MAGRDVFTDTDVNILVGVLMDWENAGSPDGAYGLVSKGGDDTVHVSVVLGDGSMSFGKQLVDVMWDSRFDVNQFAHRLKRWEPWPVVLPVKIDLS